LASTPSWPEVMVAESFAMHVLLLSSGSAVDDRPMDR
jgi:hypothetical protein